jgi:ketosteroid isomerase-like protein
MNTANNTFEVGKKLVDYCKQGQNSKAIDELYAQDIVSIEPQGSPDMPAESRGLEAVRGKNKWFEDHYDIKKVDLLGPFPHGDQFTVYMKYDTVEKKTNKRVPMEEIALYTTKNGKIVKEEFFAQMQ